MDLQQKSGLNLQTIDLLKSVFEKYPQVEKVILYGSRAKGNYKPGSDIDMTILGSNVDTGMRHKIENEIDDLMLPYKIDLSIFHQIENPDLIDHIKRVGIQLFARF
jgi:predicted nucleotidyltransferase